MLEFLGFIFICTLIVGMIFFVVYTICTLNYHEDHIENHYSRLHKLEDKVFYGDDEKDPKE